MIIANPIYDIVFKFLMEDERVARTILSALLKENIVHVEVRPHEYSNAKRDTLSVFRIDFGATILDDEGQEQLVLIEVQKTWLPTETLRFRQYLGVQYENPKNMLGGTFGDKALRMVAVYLLGHKVGDVEEPVLYVKHRSYDYDGRLVTKGMPNAFVDSLTHDSIIVQIPRLHGRINNRLDEVLSVFDQTRQAGDNQHMLNLDDRLYEEGDADMQRILHRLTMAAADASMRQDMNVEDEYFSIIEKRETEIMQKDNTIALQNEQLAQRNAHIKEQDAQLAQRNAHIKEQDAQLAQQEQMLRKSVQALLAAGMEPQAVAAALNTDLPTVQRLASA